MTKEWVEQKNREYNARLDTIKDTIRKEINELNTKNEAWKKKLYSVLDHEKVSYKDVCEFDFSWIGIDDEHMSLDKDFRSISQRWSDMLSELYERDLRSGRLEELNPHDIDPTEGPFDRYLDSEKVEFEGDIIITDPCYITKERDMSTYPKWDDFMIAKSMKEYPDYNQREDKSVLFDLHCRKMDRATEQWRKDHPDDWEICDYGYSLEKLGITKFMTRDTLYGDWSCTTFKNEIRRGNEIGEFCADAGLVSVISLDQVLKYNPDFDYHINRKHTTTWIKNFRGTVQFVVIRESGTYEDDTEFHSKGDSWENLEVRVIGRGVDIVTGQTLNFITTQTGL